MRCRAPGKICDGLYYLGHAESGVYLVAGRNEAMIISGGMSYIAPVVARQLQELGVGEDCISSMLILHAHFDHIGIVPFFRQRHPDLKVYASARAWQILTEPRNILTINQFGRRVTEHLGIVDSEYVPDWRPGPPGETVYEDSAINLGGIDVHILETPGHSSCSVTAYVPQLQALFPSDGGGIPYKEAIVAAPNSNFIQYTDSLKKMERLTVKYLCADHFGYVTGDEALSYVARSLESTEQEYRRLAAIYHRVQDVEIAAKEAASSFLAQNPDYFLSPDIYEGICRQMMKQIARFS